MNKRERISQWLAEATGENVKPDQAEVERHPYYRAFFRCWNEQRYYEAHDVLEQLWLNTESPDVDFFKGLIQAAGAFVHLQKRFEHPSHAKHSRRLPPALLRRVDDAADNCCSRQNESERRGGACFCQVAYHPDD